MLALERRRDEPRGRHRRDDGDPERIGKQTLVESEPTTQQSFTPYRGPSIPWQQKQQQQQPQQQSAFDQNIETLRASIDAELAGDDLITRLSNGLRPLVEQVLGKAPGGKTPVGIRVAAHGKEYFSSQHLSGGKTDKKAPGDDGVLSAVLGDVLEGLLGGIVAAGIDYLRFNRATMEGNVAEYRPEQIGTQVQIGSLLGDVGGTGAALAFAAFQWCFTNDMLFYAFAYLDDNHEPGWNDTRAGVEHLVSDGKITWASWSLYGLLTGTGKPEHPMSFAEALGQATILGPWLAFALATLAETLDLGNLIGSLLELSIDTQLEREIDHDAIMSALCVRLKIAPDRAAQLIAKIAPLSGDVKGARVTGVLQVTDELVNACVGIGIDFQQAGKTDEGKTQAHGQTTSFIADVVIGGAPVSLSVSARVPIAQTWRDNDQKPLDEKTRQELHVSDAKYESDLERLELRVRTGQLDFGAELRSSFRLQELFVGAGFQYTGDKLSLSGKAWLLTGVRRHPDVGFTLTLGLQLGQP